MNDKRYVSYYRVSKDSHDSGRSKAEGLGLEAQRNICHHFYPNIVKEFTETKSAKNITDRPILQEAIKYAIENDLWICVGKLDRLSRNVDDVRAIVKQLDGNISFGDIPAEGKADIFTITIYAAFSERERTLISLRTKQALKVKKEREGLWQLKSEKWKNLQDTFVKTGDFQKLAVAANIKKAQDNENNSRAAQLIIAKRSEGMSYDQIADLLNASKFTASAGGAFTATQVMRLYKRHALQKEAA